MRKNISILLLLAITFLAYSCASSLETVARDEVIDVTGYDFSKYTDQGFLITPEQYLGDYQSIGLITVTQWPAVRKMTKRVPNPESASGYETVEEFYPEDINVDKAIDETYNVAKEMGADAITRFDVTTTSRMNGTLSVPGVEISGFAIKRKGEKTVLN